MGSIVNKITDTVGLTNSGYAEDMTKKGYAASVAGQKEGLEYLRGIDEPIREQRNAAMDQYSGMYLGDQERPDFAEGIEDDPFYNMIMDTMGDRQESYARTQGATGNLRGGETIMGLGDLAADTKKEAFATGYGNRKEEYWQDRQDKTQGLKGIMDLPDYTADIYGGITGIGNTQGKGLIEQGNARGEANQAGMNNVLGIGSLLKNAPSIIKGVGAVTSLFSDARLKENIEYAGHYNGIKLYDWDWGDAAEKFGLTGRGFGVIAQEIKESHPEYIIEDEFYKVKESFYEDVVFN